MCPARVLPRHARVRSSRDGTNRETTGEGPGLQKINNLVRIIVGVRIGDKIS